MANIDAEEVKKFVMENRLPLVTEFTQETASKIFGGEVKNHMLLFIRKKADDFQSNFDTFKQIAQNYKGKVRTVCQMLPTHVHVIFSRVDCAAPAKNSVS